jgi:hypothetical protein
MKTCFEALTLGDIYSNIQKSFQESIQTQQEYLKIQQEKQEPSFQLVIDKEKSIYRYSRILVL